MGSNQTLSLALGVLALASSADANQVWIVDKNNGPGTDFVSLPTAVATAADGDVLVVRAALYHGFTVSGKGLVMLAETGVILDTTVSIANVGSGQRFVMSRFDCTDHFDCTNSAGPIYLDQLSVRRLNLTACDDVRMRWSYDFLGTRVDASRLETHSSAHLGYQNYQTYSGPQTPPGINGLTELNGSFVHAVSCRLRGGKAPDTSYILPGTCFYRVGSGGIGLAVGSQSTALLVRSGRAASCRGAEMGHEDYYFHYECGDGGDGASVDATGLLRHSGGVAFVPFGLDPYGTLPACWSAGSAIELAAGAQLDTPVDRDPSLDVVNRPSNGVPVALALYGPPGSSVTLIAGDDFALAPTPNVLVPLLVSPQFTLPLGTLPPNGALSYALNVGPQSTGDIVVLQAELTLPSGEIRRTNSIPIVYR